MDVSERVVLEFDNVIERDGRAYYARAVGEERSDGLWEGWIEFEGGAGGLRTDRETTQPNRDTLHYWATGLTHAYLEGALARAVSHSGLERRWDMPLHGGAAAADHTRVAMPPPRRAVLDPFAVHASGRDLLRDQLGALHSDQLRNIIRGYALDANMTELASLTEWEMRALILQEVERRAAAG